MYCYRLFLIYFDRFPIVLLKSFGNEQVLISQNVRIPEII